MLILVCAQCLRDGLSPPALGFETLRSRGTRPAKTAITITNGEALCGEHAPAATP